MKRVAVVLAIASASAVALSGRAAPSSPSSPSSPISPAFRADPALALAALDRRIADLDAEEQSDKQEIERLGVDVARRRVQVVTRARSFYKLTRAGLLPVGGGFASLVAHAMHVERARRQLVADLELETHARARAGDLARDLDRVARDRGALASQRTSMDAARIAMAEEQNRQAAFDHAFESSSGNASDYVAVYGGNGAPQDPLAGAFAAARGRLLFPIAGRAEVKAAHREGTDGPGLELHAPVGTAVRSVFAGKVAFADRYGPYGRIVILDHGDHYYTVNGDLDEVDVKIGQDVGAGERIGTVGDDGQGAMLYFEVRHGSQTIAPGPWLGL